MRYVRFCRSDTARFPSSSFSTSLSTAPHLLEERRTRRRFPLALHALDVLCRDKVECLAHLARRSANASRRGDKRDGRTSRKRSVQRMRQASSLGARAAPGLVMQAVKLGTCGRSRRVARRRERGRKRRGRSPSARRFLRCVKGEAVQRTTSRSSSARVKGCRCEAIWSAGRFSPRHVFHQSNQRDPQGLTHVDELLRVRKRCRRESWSARQEDAKVLARNAPSCCSTSCLIWAALARASSAERAVRLPKRDDMLGTAAVQSGKSGRGKAEMARRQHHAEGRWRQGKYVESVSLPPCMSCLSPVPCERVTGPGEVAKR